MAGNTASKKRQKVEKRYEFEYTGDDGSIYTIPKGVTHLRFHPSITHLKYNAFDGYKQLREVVLNEGLKSIGNFAFRGCHNLQSIRIPSTLTEIGHWAFWGCKSLQEVVFNDDLTSIGGHAFRECISLESITIPSTVKQVNGRAFLDCSSLRAVVLNEGLETIGVSSFGGCTSLQSIALPSTLTEVCINAFENCSRLREVILDGLPEFERDVFDDCTSLERFKFPSLSTRVENIIKAGHIQIVDKIVEIPAVEWRNEELFIPAVRRQLEHLVGWAESRMVTQVEVDREKIDKITTLTSYYEQKEATTLFELALWKVKIDQVHGINPTNTNREACRIEVPGPVKDTILQYIG